MLMPGLCPLDLLQGGEMRSHWEGAGAAKRLRILLQLSLLPLEKGGQKGEMCTGSGKAA